MSECSRHCLKKGAKGGKCLNGDFLPQTEDMGSSAHEQCTEHSNKPKDTKPEKYPHFAESERQQVLARGSALCPLDGRYWDISNKLSQYLSEKALVERRTWAEVCWLEDFMRYATSDPRFDENTRNKIFTICAEFADDSYLRIKEIERVTNHDVKAVELFVAEKLQEMGLGEFASFVHIGCTSEDITNVAYAMMIEETLEDVWIPAAESLIDVLVKLSAEHATTAMLAHTHGQPATPTTVGKEFAVYVNRLESSLERIRDIKPQAKFNGATGNYAALSVAFPGINWPEESKGFIESMLLLEFNPTTTQVESRDYICHILDGIRHFGNIIRDLDLDMWLYISMGYFKQITVKTEVGSSTMPNKVNPIMFENSEANIKMGSRICEALSDELPRSRMQRDLSDSSLIRNIGLAFGYSLQAIEQTIKGLSRVEVNKEQISADLDSRWEVLAEPIQTMLRKHRIPDAYDQLKDLTRGKKVTKEIIQEFIKSLDIPEGDKNILLALTPASYTGFAAQIVQDQLKPYC